MSRASPSHLAPVSVTSTPPLVVRPRAHVACHAVQSDAAVRGLEVQAAAEARDRDAAVGGVQVEIDVARRLDLVIHAPAGLVVLVRALGSDRAVLAYHDVLE